jgi:protein-S-isoprenylcysteine O-methyltransferase Ste14
MIKGLHFKIKPFFLVILTYAFSWLLYFLPIFIFTGTVAYPVPWIYFGLQSLNSIIIFLLIDPELLKERMSKKPDVKKWDVFFNTIYSVFGMLILLVAGLDVGIIKSMPELPLALRLSLIGFLLLCAVFADWSMLVNSFFSRYVRIQTDRGHHVVNKGPYRIVRHPGYLSAIVLLSVLPLILNSFLAYIPAMVCICFMIWRTYKEDTVLKKELEGYREYTLQVKYRLIPGIF